MNEQNINSVPNSTAKSGYTDSTTKSGNSDTVPRGGYSDAVRQSILEVTTEKMRKVGIRSVSIDDICRDLGMSKKTFYVYFESKDQLVEEMLTLHEQQMERKVLGEVEGKSTIQILHEWGEMAQRNEKDLEQPPPIMYDLLKYYPALCARHKEHICEMMHRNMVRFIQKGQGEGVFRANIDADVTAQLVAFSHYLLMEQIQQYPKRRDEIVRIARQGLDIMAKGILSEEVLKTMRESE